MYSCTVCFSCDHHDTVTCAASTVGTPIQSKNVSLPKLTGYLKITSPYLDMVLLTYPSNPAENDEGNPIVRAMIGQLLIKCMDYP